MKQGPRRTMAQDKRFRVNIVDDEAMLVTPANLAGLQRPHLAPILPQEVSNKDPVEILG